MSSKIEDTPQKPCPAGHWRSVPVFGIGQNGLLVVLPVLVIQTNLSLSVWAALLMLRTNAVSAIFPMVGKANFPYWQ